MKVVFASRTGNVESFVEKLGVTDVFQIQDGSESVEEKFVLITYTDGYGDVPEEVNAFLENNHNNLVAVAASGSKGYGEAYCLSADVISEKYNVPIIIKFEDDGTNEDVKLFIDELSKF